MERLQREGILRETNSGWFLFYAHTNEAFDGPFPTSQKALRRFDSLCAFDRMVLCCRPPGMSETDRAFLEGTENGRQFERNPAAGEYYRKKALKHGKKVGRGEVYKASLARFPGDPRAFVSDLGQAKRVMEMREEEAKRNEGPPEEVDIADSIVDQATARKLQGQTVTGKEYKEVREKVRDRMRPKWKKVRKEQKDVLPVGETTIISK